MFTGASWNILPGSFYSSKCHVYTTFQETSIFFNLLIWMPLIFKRAIVKLWTWQLYTWICIIIQYFVFFLYWFYSRLCVYKKHNLLPLAGIKAPFLFFRLLLQVWWCIQGEVGNNVFALWSLFLKGISIFTQIYLHCNWPLGGWYSCFNLNPRQLLWRWLTRNRSC